MSVCMVGCALLYGLEKKQGQYQSANLLMRTTEAKGRLSDVVILISVVVSHLTFYRAYWKYNVRKQSFFGRDSIDLYGH